VPQKIFYEQLDKTLKTGHRNIFFLTHFLLDS